MSKYRRYHLQCEDKLNNEKKYLLLILIYDYPRLISKRYQICCAEKLAFAIQVALLHDSIEDTTTSFEELHEVFGIDVARGVSALSKNESVPKEDRMRDCLLRIKNQPKEVWSVKLADRITNLQAPPQDWSSPKRAEYLQEARLIYDELKEGNEYLADRLMKLLNEYSKYL
jgi:guanosine-3',5'-bis(diphosphate) 3'-pyrophosphohydrolase